METLKEAISREVTFKPIKDKISVFIGMRRTGKTTFLLQQIINILKEGYEIDFLSRAPQGEIKLWQVVWDLKNEKIM